MDGGINARSGVLNFGIAYRGLQSEAGKLWDGPCLRDPIDAMVSICLQVWRH